MLLQSRASDDVKWVLFSTLIGCTRITVPTFILDDLNSDIPKYQSHKKDSGTIYLLTTQKKYGTFHQIYYLRYKCMRSSIKKQDDS